MGGLECEGRDGTQPTTNLLLIGILIPLTTVALTTGTERGGGLGSCRLPKRSHPFSPPEDGIMLNDRGSGSNETNGYFYTSYQWTAECMASFPPVNPKTLSELQAIVKFALRNNYRVKAVGARHSITDAICTDGLLLDMTGIRHFAFDPRTKHATVGSGMEVFDFLEKLHQHGRGLLSSPTNGKITVGGGVAMGSHGTSLQEPSSLSDQLVSVKFVDGWGNVRRVSEGEEDFQALKVSLGLLGIIYELEFRTVAQYKIQMSTFPTSDRILEGEGSEDIMDIAKKNDFLQFFWFPSNKQVVMSIGKRVPGSSPGNCQSYLESEAGFLTSNFIAGSLELFQWMGSDVLYFVAQSYAMLASFWKVPLRTPVYTDMEDITDSSHCLPNAVGWSHRMMTNRCKDCPWKQGRHSLVIEDAAAAIDVAELPHALKTLREILGAGPGAAFPIVGILFRFMKASDSYMSGSNNRTTVEIEWVTVPRFDRSQPKLGIATFQAIGQALIERHDGRPPWSKGGLYYTSPRVIHRAYPNLPQFGDSMRRLDPHELFMNDLGRRIKYGRDSMTLSKAAKERCALNEACLCKQDSDCGDGGSLVCGELLGFKVCQPSPSIFRTLRGMFSRNVVALSASLFNRIGHISAIFFDNND